MSKEGWEKKVTAPSLQPPRVEEEGRTETKEEERRVPDMPGPPGYSREGQTPGTS